MLLSYSEAFNGISLSTEWKKKKKVPWDLSQSTPPDLFHITFSTYYILQTVPHVLVLHM